MFAGRFLLVFEACCAGALERVRMRLRQRGKRGYRSSVAAVR